jgi:hypothetical protein
MVATGCRLVSGQIFAHRNLPNPMTIRSSGFDVYPVDLNSIEQYRQHRRQIKKLDDIAVVGRFKNIGGQGGGVQVFITAANTSYTDAASVRAKATLLWGATLPAGVNAMRDIGWDESAAMFTAAGKNVVLNEAKGDGMFTLYVLGTAGTYQIEVKNGALIMVISGNR